MKRAVLATFLVLAGCGVARADGFPPPIELPTLKAGAWTYEITPDGTINRRYASLNEGEELAALTELAQQEEQRRREQLGVEPNIWRVIYALCPEADMVWVDRDGTRYRQVAGMGTDERAWALMSEQQYYDCAYAYSRGNIRIEATDVVMAEPLLGEYDETCFFWPRDWPDLGIGVDVDRHDSLIGHCDGSIRPVDDLTRRLHERGREPGANERIAAVEQELTAARREFLATYRRAEAVIDDEYHVLRCMWIDALPRYANGADVLAVACTALYDSHDGGRAAGLRVLGELQQRAAQREELDEFRSRVASAVPRITELLGDYYTPVREQAVAIFEDVTGTSLETATGRSAEDWRRAFPRPGDPRSPYNAYRSSLGDGAAGFSLRGPPDAEG